MCSSWISENTWGTSKLCNTFPCESFCTSTPACSDGHYEKPQSPLASHKHIAPFSPVFFFQFDEYAVALIHFICFLVWIMQTRASFQELGNSFPQESDGTIHWRRRQIQVLVATRTRTNKSFASTAQSHKFLQLHECPLGSISPFIFFFICAWHR